MKQRKQKEGEKSLIQSAAITLVLLGAAFFFSSLLKSFDGGTGNYVSLLFVLVVAIISRFTDGYFWGIFASVVGVVCVNYVFTFPYWELNFTMTGYPVTFLTMLAVAVMVSALTTQIKKQERLRVETEREAMRANLLRAVSHDIRTPLTSIVGNTAAILENDDTLSREQQRRLLTDVNEDAQWLIRMVENLLSITRINDEQAKLNKDYEVVEEIVAEAVRKFEKRFPTGVKIDVEVPQDVLLVPMDATLISQVLLNLFENAVFHGGDVTQLRLSVLQEGEFACFRVSDNGCGIPKEKLPVIFEGLGSTSFSRSDMKKNMGIGLSVCRTIVKAHGGYMTAENLSGGGACFRFYLPMKETANNED